MSAVYGLRVERVVFPNRNFDLTKYIKNVKIFAYIKYYYFLCSIKKLQSQTFDIMKIVYSFFDPVITEDFMSAVADFEGFSATAYQCPGGKYTVGFGHTSGVTSSTRLTLEIASFLLYADLRCFYIHLCKCFPSFSSLPTSVQQAILDFTFNLGLDRVFSSNMSHFIQTWGDCEDADERLSNIIRKYVYANGKRLRGLVKRREWEISLIKGC